MARNRKQKLSRRARRLSRKRRTRRQRGGGAEPPLQYSHPGARIKVYLNADKRKPTLNALLDALKRHKYSYEVLGFGMPWEGWETRTRNYLKALSKHQGEPYVAFIDAYDCYCIKDESLLLDHYLNRPRKHIPLVFGAETCCFYNNNIEMLKWHDMHIYPGRSQEILAGFQPLSRDDPKHGIAKERAFLNYGFILGPVADVIRCIEGVRDSGEKDDQLGAASYALKNLERIDIDLEESLIRNKIGEEGRAAKLPDEGPAGAGPAFLHFPDMRDDSKQARLLDMFKRYE